MSEVVPGVLKLTFGLLANKIRGGVAERLKDGDVTDEECRRLIVRELDDIKNKLDGLARKDLLSSILFLQEGINGLYQSVSPLDSDCNTAESNKQASLVEGTTTDSPINEAIALLNDVKSLKIRSNDRFKSAIKSFELAREKATDAFSNEALSIEDRIQASQIRMMARILEKWEDPDASVSDCLQYLQQLHDIGAIQQIFSVLIDGGIKSLFNKEERVVNASSVHMINQILFEFARKFTRLPTRCSEWPVISFGKKVYRPVSAEPDIAVKLEDSGVKVLSLSQDIIFDEPVFPIFSAVNSNGDIVSRGQKGSTFKIFKRSGETRSLCEPLKEEDGSECYVDAMDVDVEDKIYIIIAFRESRNQIWSFKLLIFDGNGKKKLESSLPFTSRWCVDRTYIAVHKDGKIAILNYQDRTLYIGNVCAEIKSFKIKESLSFDELRLSFDDLLKVRLVDFDETKIIAAENFCNVVHIYKENGEFQSEIKIPEGYDFIYSFAINHSMKQILVQTSHQSGCSLLSFSETGELVENLYLGPSKWVRGAMLTSHFNGPVALVGERGAAFIQLK